MHFDIECKIHSVWSSGHWREISIYMVGIPVAQLQKRQFTCS